jgi:hypothetical protein
MTEQVTAITAATTNPLSIAEERTKNFPRKPARGGTPAIERRVRLKVNPKTGFILLILTISTM